MSAELVVGIVGILGCVILAAVLVPRIALALGDVKRQLDGVPPEESTDPLAVVRMCLEWSRDDLEAERWAPHPTHAAGNPSVQQFTERIEVLTECLRANGVEP